MSMASGSRHSPKPDSATEHISAPNTRRSIRREEIRSGKIFDEQLLYSRDQVMRLLGGISYDTICRLEGAGKLRRVQLNIGKAPPGKSTTKVLYRREDVFALIEGATSNALKP
ncbi:hypothetical protein JQ580_29860 [Bradyrhizobium japonicum]|uniref:hypothetical protein n=1 Tax=Bradyrhizobium japonicum TaxID=375 RepID=UPI001BA69268|nr:hypothetical protein [Bradyrhizobium japonicum]MBR0994922.1 hypothetical protein [Bradyrhizobium japonicum]